MTQLIAQKYVVIKHVAFTYFIIKITIKEAKRV